MRSFINCKSKAKGKDHLRDCFCRHRRGAKYNSNPFATSALEWGQVLNATWQTLYTREIYCTHCEGGLVGLGAALDGGGKSRFRRDSIPGPSDPWRVTIWTALSRSLHKLSISNAIRAIKARDWMVGIWWHPHDREMQAGLWGET